MMLIANFTSFLVVGCMLVFLHNCNDSALVRIYVKKEKFNGSLYIVKM